MRAIPRISQDQVLYKNRKFASCLPQVQRHLERVGVEFLAGYAQARLSSVDETNRVLRDVDPQWRGFGYEGAAFAYALYDIVLVGSSSRWRKFAEIADEHIYVCHVALGWAMGKTRPIFCLRSPKPDPLLESLVYDGYGFVTGYFKHKKCLKRAQPTWLRGHRKCAYDQGLGRSLWFSCGAIPDRIATTIASLGVDRSADLWAGVGLAAAYAGGVEEADYRKLFDKAGPFQGHLIQGAAFGAEARIRGSILVPHTELVCNVFLGESASTAATIVQRNRELLDPNGGLAEYEKWRRLCRQQCSLLDGARRPNSPEPIQEQPYVCSP